MGSEKCVRGSFWIDLINPHIDGLRGVICRSDVNVRALGGLRREVGRGGEVVVARVRLHDICNEPVPAVLTQRPLINAEIRVPARRVQSLSLIQL